MFTDNKELQVSKVGQQSEVSSFQRVKQAQADGFVGKLTFIVIQYYAQDIIPEWKLVK